MTSLPSSLAFPTLPSQSIQAVQTLRSLGLAVSPGYERLLCSAQLPWKAFRGIPLCVRPEKPESDHPSKGLLRELAESGDRAALIFPWVGRWNSGTEHRSLCSRPRLLVGAQHICTLQAQDDAMTWGIISSRLRRQHWISGTWFCCLTEMIRRFERDWPNAQFLTAPETTAHRFVQHAMRRFGRTTVHIQGLGTGNKTHDNEGLWKCFFAALGAHRRASSSNLNSSMRSQTNVCWVSPPLPLELPYNDVIAIVDVPERDQWLMQLSDQLLVLHVRRNGNMERLLKIRLSQHDTPRHSVYFCDHPELISKRLANELESLGAVRLAPNIRPAVETSIANRSADDSRIFCAMHWRTDQSEFVTHSTRARNGPWPNQDSDQYFDETLFSLAIPRESPLDSLLNILRGKRLCASSLGIRGGFRVVSFTEIPFLELQEHRLFRDHRHRWEFEPYAVSIRKSYLEEIGGRKVIYGTDETWSSLPNQDLPYFQLQRSRSRNKPGIDWTHEREWRVAHDIDLLQIPNEHIRVLVPNDCAARRVAAVFSGSIGILPSPCGPTLSPTTRPHVEITNHFG